MDLRHIRFRSAPPVLPAERRIAREQRVIADRGGSGYAETVDGLPAHVLRRAGLVPEAYRAAPLRRRVAACLRALRVGSEAAAVERLASSDRLIEEALSSLLLGVTSFFRDAMVFDVLRTGVLPALAGRKAPLRILSVGCASGAELYSMAMLLDEAQMLDRTILVGTDCRADAVRSARTGRFDEAALATLSPERRARYFEPVARGYRVVEPLLRRTNWIVADVTRPLFSGGWDIVLCRNLLMYLEPALADATCRRLAAGVAPGGVLVLGKAERPPAALGCAPLARCVYRSHAA
jgi:chemotaxis protein methyltransferase CheR